MPPKKLHTRSLCFMRFFANAQNDGGAYGDEILHPKGFRMTSDFLGLKPRRHPEAKPKDLMEPWLF